MHKVAAWRSTGPRKRFAGDAIVPEREPLIDVDRNAATVEKRAKLRCISRRRKYSTQSLARAGTKAASREMLTVPNQARSHFITTGLTRTCTVLASI
eukprot:5101036-Pleurochrysis_carterae.AAC.1